MRVRPQTLARCTWVVLAVVFVGLLGGFHPSDRGRDLVVGAAAVIVGALNLPAIFAALALPAGRARALVLVAARLGIAAAVLVFVRGVSHERPDWHAKDAWRRCRADARWPDDAVARCRALHMCLHESDADAAALRDLVAATPGCPAP